MLAYFSKVLYVLEGKRKGLLFLLFIFALTSVLEALGIGLIGPFLNVASSPKSIHKISLLDWVYRQLELQDSIQIVPILGIGIAIIFCLKSLLYFLSWAKIYQYSSDLNQSLITKLLNAYLAVPYAFHLNRNTASLIKNILIETSTFTGACILPLLRAAVNFIVLLFLFLLLAKTNLLLLAMIMGILLPIFILFNLLGNKFKKWGRIKSESKQEMVRILNHGLGGLKETRVIGCESYFEKQMAQKAQQFAKADSLFSTSQILPRILIETALIVFIMLFISLSIILLKQDMQEITGTMGVFALASMRRDMEGKAILCRKICPEDNCTAPFYGTSVMLLDCSKLTHWQWEKQIEEMFNFERDYQPWTRLCMEPEDSIGLLEEEWNHLDTLNEKTKLLHNTRRETQPWKTGLPIDFNRPNRKSGVPKKWGLIPVPWIRRTKALIQGKEYYPSHLYFKHPDSNQEKLFFSLLRECLAEGIFTEELLISEMENNHLRKDTLQMLQYSQA